jgi:hypothetical protein
LYADGAAFVARVSATRLARGRSAERSVPITVCRIASIAARFSDERAQILDLGAVEVDQVVLLERRVDGERIQGTSRHHLAGLLRDMRPSPGEGIDVHVVELVLLLADEDLRSQNRYRT